MKHIKNVNGSMEFVLEKEFNKDTIYIRENIVKLENGLWQYDETQYSYEEWVALTDSKTGILSSDIDKLKTENTKLTYSTFDLDFRMMEVETIIEEVRPQPTVMMVRDNTINTYNTRGVMDMTPYDMAKTLILAGMYDRADMDYKLSVYLKRGRMTQEQVDELTSLMDAQEIVK